MKAVVTVIGCDRIGIIAGVANILSELEINIMDISQTIMDEYFTMIMFVDLNACKKDFKMVQDELDGFGREYKLSVKVQRQDLFDSMYSI